MVSPFSSVFVQRPESPRSELPWPTASPLVSLSLTLANMGFNPITRLQLQTPNQLSLLGGLWHLPLIIFTIHRLFLYPPSSLSTSQCLLCLFLQTLSLFLYLIKLLLFYVYFLFIRTALYFCSFLPSCRSVSQFSFLFSFCFFFSLPPTLTHLLPLF